MPKYELNLNITEKYLPIIYKANQEVIIVKHVEGESNVVWIAFKPFEYNNVTWNTDFAIYASSSNIQSGAKIKKLSAKNAQTQVRYSFEEAIFKANANNGISVDKKTFLAENNMEGFTDLTFGLAQSLEVNGKLYPNNPINAVTVPFKHSIEMTPVEKIDVYLKSNIESGSVISKIASESIPLIYSGDVTTISILYDGAIGKFIPNTNT